MRRRQSYFEKRLLLREDSFINVDIGVKKRCRIMSPDFPGKIIKGP